MTDPTLQPVIDLDQLGIEALTLTETLDGIDPSTTVLPDDIRDVIARLSRSAARWAAGA